MYPEGGQTTGRFAQNAHTPCPCQRCVHHEPPPPPPPPMFSHPGGPGHPPASGRQTAHPLLLDYRRDGLPAPAEDLFREDRGERRRSPQRRPVFTGPDPYGPPEDLSQSRPWDLNPAQWKEPAESGGRHCPSVREQSGCVVRGDSRTHPVNFGIPHPLPHLRVKGHSNVRTVKYVSVDKEEARCAQAPESCRWEPHSDPLLKPNGHCELRLFEGAEERDPPQNRARAQGGPQEFCNGRRRSHKGFFPTEVPQQHLNRAKGHCAPSSGVSGPEGPKQNQPVPNELQSSEGLKPKRRSDSVRDQIRQVVTDLEDVLGGLKQVHVEMKEVVEEIDRLTASIALGEETLGITHSSTDHASVQPGDHRVAASPSHKPPHALQQFDGDRIILRTNSPSPVHMASVVKTSCFTPPSHNKDVTHERSGPNGHPPHLGSNHISHPEPPQPHSLDPKVVIGNSTSVSRSLKPPPYPQNGRCGKSSYPLPKAARNPAHPGRGRQNTSMV